MTVAWVVLWFLLATNMREGIAGWAEARRAEGYSVEYAKLEMSGFPFWLRATLEQPEVAPPSGKDRWSWQGLSLVLESRPWSWNTIFAHTRGRQAVSLPVGDETVAFDGTAAGISAEIAFDDGRPAELRMAAEGVKLTAVDPGLDLEIEIGSGHLTIRRLPEGGKHGRSAELDLAFWDVVLPGGPDTLPLGNRIRKLEVGADIEGPLPEPLHHDTLTTWRDAGGTVEIRRLTLAYGPAELTTNGTLALDEALQPTGAFTARIRGFFQAVDALRSRGLVRRRDAVTAKLLLSVLTKRPRDGGPPSLSVPLTIQNRKFYVGPVPLLTLEPVTWPGTPTPKAPPGDPV